MANIIINNNVLQNVDIIRVKDADNEGNYLNYTINNIYSNISYNPVNALVNEYIINVDYTNQPYDTSSVSQYSHEQSVPYRKDCPAGFNIVASGTSTISVDNICNRNIRNDLVANEYSFYNFVPGADCGLAIILNSSGISKFINVSTTNPHPLRMINVPSVFNVRDHGGWNCDGGYVKYGVLYRGGSFNTITSSDKKILTDFLGIKCEIDFMFAYQGGELAESLLGSQVEYVCIPTNASYENLVIPGLYKDGAYVTNDTKDVLKSILDKIFYNTEYGIPTYYHCSLGADRTGTLGFIIDALLGMSQSDVDKEWELTSFAEAERNSSPRARNATNSYWRYPDLVYYFMGGNASRTYTHPEDNTYKANHNSGTYPGFGKNNLRDNVAQWAITELGISLSEINKFRRNMIVGNPQDIVL